nr:MAG: nonstructural protein [Microviridae sp.]
MSRQIFLYSIYDKVSGSFMQPVSVPTDGVAVRSCRDSLAQQNSPFRAHPADYELYKLGSWDDTTGTLVSLSVPELVVKLASLVSDDESAAR